MIPNARATPNPNFVHDTLEKIRTDKARQKLHLPLSKPGDITLSVLLSFCLLYLLDLRLSRKH